MTQTITSCYEPPPPLPSPHHILPSTWASQGNPSLMRTTSKAIMKLTTSTVIVLCAFIQLSLTCFPILPPPPPPLPPPPPRPPTTSSSSSSSNNNHNNINKEVAYDLECKCGVPSKNRNRIVGGQPAEKNEYPWQVAIKAKPDKKPFCGGSILSSRTILTAAHCNIYKLNEIRYRDYRYHYIVVHCGSRLIKYLLRGSHIVYFVISC